MKLKNLIPLLPAAAVLAAMFFSHSCANTTTAPTGGEKDTIPPSLTGVEPMPGTLNVPVSFKKTRIVFTFDEYVVVKNQQNIFLSPPLSKPLKASTRGKSVVISFEEDLLPNTTYTLDITGAIVDNNEGNPFPGFSLMFSTGERLDSMYLTGLVQDCATLLPLKDATVLLYKDHADSAIFLHRPDAAVKTDDWGFFCLRNIQDTLYRLYALVDENNNNMYDPETEKVGFCDSIIRPPHKVADGIYELYKFDMLDTLSCLKRKTDYTLNVFKGLNSKQMIMNYGRTDLKTTFVTFMSERAKVFSTKFKGISDKRIIRMFNPQHDSLVMWINSSGKLPDTLHLSVDYMKTDSLGKLVRTTEKLKLSNPKEKKLKSARTRSKLKHEDTIAVFKVETSPETFEQCGITIGFDYPLLVDAFDSLKYEVINPRQKVEKGKYTLVRDSLDVRKATVHHAGKILPGYEYKLTVPYRAFKDLYGHYNDSLVTSVKLPTDEKLSHISVNLSGVDGKRYIVDIMSDKKDKVLRSYTVDKDGTLEFPYLKAGKYCFRIIQDSNFNNMVDTGDLLSHLQPEKVRFYVLPDGTQFIDLPESTELSQDIDIHKLFDK